MPDPATPSAIKLALELYRDQPRGVRAFVRARHLLCPLSQIEPHVPTRGRILDLGCGHGLFSALMAVSSRDRSILGVDPSPAKTAVAEALMARLPNVRFYQGGIDDVTEGGLDAVTIIDVLYLLPRDEKVRILRRTRELLAPDGRLILKTNDTHPTWKYQVAKLQEKLMTGLHLTMGHGDLHFVGCQEQAGLLEEAGFRQVDVEHLDSRTPYPHTLFICPR